MAQRGRKPKPINFAEEIERVDLRIVHHQNSIKELTEKREQLCNQKRSEDMDNLIHFLDAHHLSPEDLLSKLHG